MSSLRGGSEVSEWRAGALESQLGLGVGLGSCQQCLEVHEDVG